MGGRGSYSGKNIRTSGDGKGKDEATLSKELEEGGNGGEATQTKRTYKKPATPISKMSDAQLKRECLEALKVYYGSGKSGVSFGGYDTDKAAEMMLRQTKTSSRSGWERQYKSVLKSLKKISYLS